MAVEAWTLRVRVSFCSAGIQESSTAALKMRSRSAATISTCDNSLGVIENCGS